MPKLGALSTIEIMEYEVDASIVYRSLEVGEENEVSELIGRVFDEYVAPDFTDEGRSEFKRYIEPEEIHKRLKDRHFILVALNSDNVVGMIEVREYFHVSLLFVDREFMGKGIAKELYRKSIELCKQRKADLERVEVNSSPYAVRIYEKLGFRAIGAAQTKNGITFVPMEHNIK